MEVDILAEKDRILCLKRKTTQSEVRIVAEKHGRSCLMRRTTQSEVKIVAERWKIASFGQILPNKKF